MRTGWASALRAVTAAAAVAATACQPFGGPDAAGPTAAPAVSGGPALGAPDAGMPSTLDELVTRATRVAEEWQDEPVLAEIEVDLDEQHRWAQASVVFVAADADRFLKLVASGSGFTQERPTLSTLQLVPVTADGIAAIPELPPDTAAPEDLAQGPAAQECDIPVPRTVLYVTGAPFAWDGTTWTAPPQWTATVTSGDVAAAVNPVTAATVRCLQ